jgi:hypothetical protein
MKTGEKLEKPKKILANGAQLADELRVSANYVYALRRAMGLTRRSRYMRLEVVLAWLESHPGFTVRGTYEDAAD